MRYIDPATHEVTFFGREDLSPEFDQLKPDGFKWGFELPQNVDFYIFMGRHRTGSDLDGALQMMDEADLVLVEGPEDAQFLLDSATVCGEEDLSYLYTYITDDDAAKAHNSRLLKEINRRKLPAVFSEPTLSHKNWQNSFSVDRQYDSDNPLPFFLAEQRSINNRDIWLLNNLKRII